MNDILLSFILGLVQGLTEFLPISSSAHLLLPTLIFGSNDLGLYFDISVHAGTLIAVVYYFRNEIFLMSKSLLVRPRDRAIIKIEMKLIFFLPNKSIEDKGKMYETNKTGSLNVPIAL